MYYSKDIESFGTGLKRITDACEKAKAKVEFQLLKKGFAVVFYRPSENFTATDEMSDVVRNVTRNVVLNKSEQLALSIIMENPYITAAQLASLLTKSSRTAQRYFDSLQKKNIIMRVGSTKLGHWEIVNNDD